MMSLIRTCYWPACYLGTDRMRTLPMLYIHMPQQQRTTTASSTFSSPVFSRQIPDL